MQILSLDSFFLPVLMEGVDFKSKVASVLLLFACVAPPSRAGEFRTWNSGDGAKIEAEYISSDDTNVTLRKVGKSPITFPLTRLSAEDQAFVEKQRQQAEEKVSTNKKSKGRLTYALSDGNEKWPDDRKRRIVSAMDEAIAFLNKHGDFKKHVTANNSPGTPTADANYDGWINWGGSISRRVALHEIGHTLGIGTHPNWQKNIKDGIWTGKHANAALKELDGKDAVLHADRQHFWPYGLNFDNESSPQNDKKFVTMLAAFRKDMGIR